MQQITHNILHIYFILVIFKITRFDLITVEEIGVGLNFLIKNNFV